MDKPIATWTRNDKKARIWIFGFSIFVFATILLLSRVQLNIRPGFDIHVFAKANAILNSCVSVLLIAGFISVKQKRYYLHKRLMIYAIILSILFLASYIAHHLLAGETRFGDIDHNGIITDDERTKAGSLRLLYYCLLGTHIPLAGIILPFILFTAYRSLTGEYEKHRKLARLTWPVWLYVAITGVLVYLLISPYY
jgi:putative membrane protein